MDLSFGMRTFAPYQQAFSFFTHSNRKKIRALKNSGQFNLNFRLPVNEPLPSFGLQSASSEMGTNKYLRPLSLRVVLLERPENTNLDKREFLGP